MVEHLSAEQLARTGWKFHFNNDTIRGRRNVVLANLGMYFGLFCVYKLSTRKTKKE